MKNLRKITAFLLCVVMLSSLCCAFADGNAATLTNVNDMAQLIEDVGTISIWKATLFENQDDAAGQAVYLVACKGMDFSTFDLAVPRSITNGIKIGLSDENNAYVKTVCDVIKANVEPGSTLVLVGHSMGGMVIQQVMANREIKQNYNVRNALALGSPYIITSSKKEGTLRRMVDAADIVPFLSIAGLTCPYRGIVGLEYSGYSLSVVHFESYRSSECWAAYDCLGAKNRTAAMNAKIVLGDSVYAG